MLGMPEGWYDDPAPPNPADPTTMRWWDGQSWTTRVRAATKRERAARREQRVAEPVAARPGSTGHTGSTGYTADGWVLAGWWSRVGAVLIDGILVGVAVALVSWPWARALRDAAREYGMAAKLVATAPAGTPVADSGPLVHALLALLVASFLLGAAIKLTYQVGFLKGCSATPGKLALGLRVRHADRPGPLSWGAVLARCLGALVMGWVPVLSLVDVLWPLGDGRRQALHDKVAGTQVVRP